MRWQKTARLAIAIFVLVFAGVVFVALWRPAPNPVRPTTPRMKTDTTVESGPFELKRFTNDGKLIVSLKAKNQFAYADGRNVLHDAELTLPDRDGRTIVITGAEMDVTLPRKGDEPIETAKMTKGVKLTASDGLVVTSDQASYDQRSGVVTIPGPVQFARERLSGSGVGATYDKNRDVLWLLDQATMKIAPDEKGSGGAEGSAKSAGLARADHYVRLTENAHVISEGRTIDTNELTIQLSQDDKVIQSMALRGNSRITGAAGASAGTGAEGMSARDIDLTYAPDGRTLQAARLMESAVVDLPGTAGTGARKVVAQTIDLGFAADGSTVTRLDAQQNVQVDLPATNDAPARRINSASLNAAGATGLQSATFSGGVTYREVRAARQGGPPAGERTGRSQRLIVETQPGLGNIQQADFRTNVHIVDGENVVEGPRVVYRIAQDTFDIAPSSEDKGPPPTVNDGRVLVHARTISFTVGTKKLVADTDVRSSIQPPTAKDKPAPSAPGRGRGAAGEGGKLPSVLRQNEAVQITANRLEYDGTAGLAKYIGAAKLWQDKTRIQGDAIDLDDRNANLTARGHVASVMFFDETDVKTKTTKLVESTATADMLVYEDGKRLATYTTGPSAKAHLFGTQGDLTGDTIKLFLKESSNELERAEADGHVVLKDERNRTATGDHLTYTPANETYVMTGAPVEVEERVGKECRLSSATTLTFDRTSDRMLMANNQSAPVKLTQCTAK
jgi:lipopolysaccharide export system protein LptA